MELQSPQLRLCPRKVGVAPPTMGLSNEGQPANRTMQPSNQEASGEKRNPSDLKRGSVIGAFCLAVWVCLAWCRLIREAFSGLIAGRLVISLLVRHCAGWRPLLFPSSLVLGAALWRRVRVPPLDKLDQTARGGQVQV